MFFLPPSGPKSDPEGWVVAGKIVGQEEPLRQGIRVSKGVVMEKQLVLWKCLTLLVTD